MIKSFRAVSFSAICPSNGQPVRPASILRLRRPVYCHLQQAVRRWGEVFGDDVVAAAMIDRLVHHAEVIALKGDSYRIKDRDLG